MQTLRELAMSYVGVPYKYAGANPLEGFDCSGLVCELLKSCGILPHKADLCAQQLYDLFEKRGTPDRWALGSLAFYGQSATQVVHVAFCLDQFRAIEAGGGDHTTLTREDALRKNACVRIRPIKFRSDFIGVIKPDYSIIGVV